MLQATLISDPATELGFPDASPLATNLPANLQGLTPQIITSALTTRCVNETAGPFGADAGALGVAYNANGNLYTIVSDQPQLNVPALPMWAFMALGGMLVATAGIMVRRRTC